MGLQADISTRRLAGRIGSIQQVLVDEVNSESAIARSHADAPEIDGLVFIEGATNLRPGDLVNVRVNDANEHDLFASPVQAQ